MEVLACVDICCTRLYILPRRVVSQHGPFRWQLATALHLDKSHKTNPASHMQKEDVKP